MRHSTHLSLKGFSFGASEVAQKVRALVLNPDDLGLLLQTLSVEWENELLQVVF